MAERKGLNKYHPADFDPKKIPRIRKPKNHQKKIRFMLPVRARCNKCGNYMSEGTKFNSREEQVTEETYLGIKIYRFYFKCTNCSTELTIKTDPKNCGYSGDGSGATFLYNGHEEEDTKKKHRENVLESLEKRTMVSKRGIEVMAALDELKSMKSRQASVSVDSMLEALNTRKKQQEEEENEEEEKLIRSIKFGKRARIDDQETKQVAFGKIKNKPKIRKSPTQVSSLRITLQRNATKLSMGLESLCHNYGTDNDDEEK